MESCLRFYEIFFVENLKNPALFWREFCQKWQEIQPSLGETDTSAINLLLTCQIFNSENGQDLVKKFRDLKILRHFSISEFREVLRSSGNNVLATFMEVNPDDVLTGALNWEKIILDLWPLLHIEFEALADVLGQHEIIFAREVENISQQARTNEERLAKLLCLMAQRTRDLSLVQNCIYFLGISKPHLMAAANICAPADEENVEWVRLHRDIFIVKAENLEMISKVLHSKGVLQTLDLERLERLEPLAKKKYLIDTLQRRAGQGMSPLIEACQESGNMELALIMSFQPIDVALTPSALQLIQFNWRLLVETVQYDHVMKFLLSRNFLSYKQHLRLQGLENEDKMREILRYVISREEFHDAFFQVISLQRRYEHVLKLCYPMDFQEQQILLEVQDFLAVHMENVDLICEKLANIQLLTPTEQELIDKEPTVLRRNLKMINILKTKGGGTIPRFRDVLWTAYNRDCAEIISIDFKRFQMSLEEWNKLKANWGKIVKTVQWEEVVDTLVSTSVLNKSEVQWIEKSAKNRQKIRKLLRILPTKERGYRILLLALSQYDEHYSLLVQCHPMDQWKLRRLVDNEEFLMDNTHLDTLPDLLHRLKQRKILTEAEEELLTCYEDPIQEMYILLRGKSNDVIEELIQGLQLTGNFDAAAVLNIDLATIKLSLQEWKDYLQMWLDFIDEIDYERTRSFFVVSGLISSIEDQYICTEPDNERRMRLLLQILPYRHNSFQTLVDMTL